MTKTWKEFIHNYEICKETCEIRSMGSSHVYGLSVAKCKPTIRKVQKNGRINIRSKGYDPLVVYKEVYGEEYHTRR